MHLVSHLTRLSASHTLPVLLVRHGRTRHNAERRFVGRLDVPLDETGQEQARRWANAYRDLPIRSIFSSPLQRARQTAEALGPARSIPGLQELDQGIFEGRLASEVMAEHPEFFAQWRQDPSSLRIPQGETLSECQTRCFGALTQLAQDTGPGQPIVVVAHQLVLASVLLKVLQLPLNMVVRLHQSNTAVNLLSYDGRWLVHRINDRSHLR